MVSLSIVIVNYNSKEYLKRCLESIFRNCPQETQIILVDNASKDGSVEMVNRVFPMVEVIENLDNAGFAKANNQGISRSYGDKILLLNPDTLYKKGVIEELGSYLDSNQSTAAVGCRIENPDVSLQYSFGKFPTIFRLILDRLPIINKRWGHLVRDGSLYDKVREVDWVTGACVMIRKKAFEKVGGFDEDYFLYVEEVDLMYRLRKAGYKVVYDPSISVTHYYEGGEKERRDDKRMYMRQGLYRFLKKHRPFWEAVIFKILVQLGF